MTHTRVWMSALAAFLMGASGPGFAGAAAGQTATPCEELEAFHALDFWLGEWEVVSGDQPVGTNRIEKILDGCAILEHWRGMGGSEGKSLFYYSQATETWRQVWVTQTATIPGGVKEKELVATLPDGSVRFQGTIPLPGGGSYLDRTTLTPDAIGRVRQVIEISQDGGATWQKRFDALYLPRGGGG